MTEIFVFGSNLAGRHGAGSALHALKYKGAVYGQGVGRQGDSYAIPTKDWSLNRLSLDIINRHIYQFLEYAREHSQDGFYVVEIGCGLAGYDPKQIAPMFKNSPENVKLPQRFYDVLTNNDS